MRRNLLSLLFSFLAVSQALVKLLISWLVWAFWSIILGLLILPYQVYRVFAPLARTDAEGSNVISKFFRGTFESKKTKRFIGVGLGLMVMFSGLISNIVAANELETDETLMVMPETELVTKTTLDKPLEGILAQGFHGFHRAIDVLAPVGTSIKPIDKGIVSESSLWRLGWGHTVVIAHENGLSSRYAHLKDIRVIEGEMVNKGQEIGTIGMTGWTTGPRLHLEIYQDGRAINPAQVLPEFSPLLAEVK